MTDPQDLVLYNWLPRLTGAIRNAAEFQINAYNATIFVPSETFNQMRAANPPDMYQKASGQEFLHFEIGKYSLDVIPDPAEEDDDTEETESDTDQ